MVYGVLVVIAQAALIYHPHRSNRPQHSNPIQSNQIKVVRMKMVSEYGIRQHSATAAVVVLASQFCLYRERQTAYKMAYGLRVFLLLLLLLLLWPVLLFLSSVCNFIQLLVLFPHHHGSPFSLPSIHPFVR